MANNESSGDKPLRAARIVEDGFGTAWQCPHGFPEGLCQMEVVRPGKSQCVCDGGVKGMVQEINGLHTELDRLENAMEAGFPRFDPDALDRASWELQRHFGREGSLYGIKACEEIARIALVAYGKPLNAAPQPSIAGPEPELSSELSQESLGRGDVAVAAPDNEVLMEMMAAWANTFGTPLTRYTAVYNVVAARLSAPSAEAPTITKHAQIGGTVFHPGIAVQTVIDRAYREYGYQQAPEREAERMEKVDRFREFCNRIACRCNTEMEKALCRDKDRCASVETFATVHAAGMMQEPSEPPVAPSASEPMMPVAEVRKLLCERCRAGYALCGVKYEQHIVPSYSGDTYLDCRATEKLKAILGVPDRRATPK